MATISIDKSGVLPEFTADGFNGWISEREAGRDSQGIKQPACIHVIFPNDRAYLDVKVIGTASLRSAIKAALPHAKARPIEITRDSRGEVYGRFLTIKAK